jgi:hypothetical protein
MTVISLRGPVEKVGGQLALMIPLAAGGFDLHSYCRSVSEIDGDFLRITIPDWLAEKLGIHEGSWVTVDNQGGKFNIRPSTDPNLI